MRTALEQLDRMNALVERMAVIDAYSRNGAGELRDEARAILDERLDKDYEIAKQICDRADIWSTVAIEAVKAGIMYGRAHGQFEAQQPTVATTGYDDLQTARDLCILIVKNTQTVEEKHAQATIDAFQFGAWDDGPSVQAVMSELEQARAQGYNQAVHPNIRAAVENLGK